MARLRWFFLALSAALCASPALAQSTPPTEPPSSSEMSFALAGNGGNCGGCEWLAADGTITANTSQAFEVFFRQWNKDNPGIPLTVALNSFGGNTFGAIALGDAIRKAGFWTSVGKTSPDGQWEKAEGGKCFSACVLAFVGGRTRIYDPAPPAVATGVSPRIAPKLGFRGWYADDATSLLGTDRAAFDALGIGVSISQIVPAAVVGYLVQMGIDPGLLTLATEEQERDGARVLTKEEAERYKVVSSSGTVTTWSLKIVRGGLVLYGKGEGNFTSYTAAVECNQAHKNALLFELAVPYKLRDKENGGIIEARLDGVLTMQATTARGTGTPVRLETKPYIYVAGHIMASGIIAGTALWMLKNEGLIVGYDGPHSLEGSFPDINLSQPTVTEAIGLLLKNCPRS